MSIVWMHDGEFNFLKLDEAHFIPETLVYTHWIDTKIVINTSILFSRIQTFSFPATVIVCHAIA